MPRSVGRRQRKFEFGPASCQGRMASPASVKISDCRQQTLGSYRRGSAKDVARAVVQIECGSIGHERLRASDWPDDRGLCHLAVTVDLIEAAPSGVVQRSAPGHGWRWSGRNPRTPAPRWPRWIGTLTLCWPGSTSAQYGRSSGIGDRSLAWTLRLRRSPEVKGRDRDDYRFVFDADDLFVVRDWYWLAFVGGISLAGGSGLALASRYRDRRAGRIESDVVGSVDRAGPRCRMPPDSCHGKASPMGTNVVPSSGPTHPSNGCGLPEGHLRGE